MTTSLTIGPAHSLVQNTVYALPAPAVHIHSTVALEISPDATTWTTLTGANTVGIQAGSTFVRSTTGAAVVTLKRV